MARVIPGTRHSILHWLNLFGVVLLGSVVPRGVGSQTLDSLAPPPPETKPNPFAGFETHHLSNGMRVWFKRLPEAPNVSPRSRPDSLYRDGWAWTTWILVEAEAIAGA